MSYILDALRRADAERERDPARGIHAQPAAGVPVRRPTRVPAWVWPAFGALLVGAGAAAWLQRPAAVPAEPIPAASLPPRTLAPVPAPPVVTVATTVVPAAPPMPAPVEKPRVVATVPAPAPARAASAAAVPAAPPASAAPAGTMPAAASAPAAAAASAPAADRVYNVAELPADVQQGVPKLAISGGVYSENPAQRMLVVGGQLMNEGAELAPGVVLEQIRPRSAVLRFRGYRYSVAY